MVHKNWFPTLTRFQISRLRAGEKHKLTLFVGICENAESGVLTDILQVKLTNQRGSQRWSKYPDGYEPFETPYGTERLNLRTMTIPVPRLRFVPVGWPNPTPMSRIVNEPKHVCVFDPKCYERASAILDSESKTFDTKHRIRRHAVKSRENLEIVLSLMAYGGVLPLCQDDPTDRLEAYLCFLGHEFLRELLDLLDTPDPLPKRAEAKLHRAA